MILKRRLGLAQVGVCINQRMVSFMIDVRVMVVLIVVLVSCLERCGSLVCREYFWLHLSVGPRTLRRLYREL